MSTVYHSIQMLYHSCMRDTLKLQAKIFMPTVCGLYYVDPTDGTRGCRYYALTNYTEGEGLGNLVMSSYIRYMVDTRGA